MLQEAYQVAQFDLIVPRVRARPEFYFFYLYLLLLLFGRVPALALFVLILSVVQYPAYGRRGIRRDLDEIQIRFFRFAQRILDGNDADLLTIGTDEANSRRGNAPVYP